MIICLWRRLTIGALLLLALLLAACAGEQQAVMPPATPSPFPPDLYLGLSDASTTLGDVVASSYEEAAGRRAPVFLTGNDEALLDDLAQGWLEAIIIHHLPADSQVWFTPIALDGVVIMVHPELPLDNLSTSQLQAIFSGSITNWADAGGPDLAIHLLNREPGSGAREILSQRIMAGSRFSSLARIAATDDFMQQEIAANPGGIGYTMMGDARGKIVRVDGQEASPDTIRQQRYPLTTPIYFVTLAEPNGPLRDFLAFIQSSDGQARLDENYGQVR